MKHHDFRVHWTTHVRRAADSFANAQRDPWHKHLYRAWQSLRGHPRYAPPPAPHHSPDAIPVRSRARTARPSRAEADIRACLRAFDRARRESGL